MKSRDEILIRLDELRKMIGYLKSFLSMCYSGSDGAQKAQRELRVVQAQIDLLLWILNEPTDDLPF